MSELIGIVGETGSGKSRSIKNLNPAETVVMNTVGKSLPFQGWKKNYTKMTDISGNFYISDDAEKIISVMHLVSDKRPEIKSIICDDFQYLMSNEFMNRASEKGYDKFTDIAKHAWMVLDHGRRLRDDLNVFILTHDQIVMEDFAPKRKMKTIGKLLDDKITLEGMFSVVLFTDVTKEKDKDVLTYKFITQSDGSTTGKSPEGMFKSLKIDNDLKLVSDSIKSYYEGE